LKPLTVVPSSRRLEELLALSEPLRISRAAVDVRTRGPLALARVVSKNFGLCP